MAGPFGSLLSGMLALRTTREPRHPDERRVGYNARTLAGVTITPDTAVQISAVWACLRYLSQTVAVLPWHVMRPTAQGSEVYRNHPVDWLLWKKPNPEWSSFQFRETLTHWALRWGNGYAELELDQVGRPFALWPVHPDRVQVCRDEDTGELYYEVSNGTGGKVDVPMGQMFHVRGFGEGPVGVNVMDYAAQSLGWARAAQLFGASFFGNGANIAGVVTSKSGFKDGTIGRLKAEFSSLYKGVRNANKTAFLDNDMDWKAIGVDPEKSQLLEINMFLVEEVCRWFGVPPHKVMHLLRSTFNNIEHQAIEVVVDSVSPWVKRFEDEADAKLFGQNRQGIYTKINMNALLRGDMKARMEFYKGMQFVGAYSPNRILEAEDENTLGPEGDIHVMQQQMVPLDKVGMHVQPPSDPAAPPPAEEGSAPEADPDEEAAMAAIRARAAALESAHAG